MNFKTSYYLMRVCGIGGIALMLIGGLTQNTVLGLAGGFAVIAGTGLCSMFFNCPHCKRSLKMREGIPSKCPYCKKPLK